MGFEMSDMTSTQPQYEHTSPPPEVSERRLWFEFMGTIIAWHILGILEVVITWVGCNHQEQLGGPSPHPAAHALYFVAWTSIFAVALMAGRMSYRSWRRLSETTELLNAEGRERKQFMSLAGLFVSLTLGFGFLWLSLPLFILQMCARTR